MRTFHKRFLAVLTLYSFSSILYISNATPPPPIINSFNNCKYSSELRLTDANNWVRLYGHQYFSKLIIDTKISDAGVVGLTRGSQVYFDEIVFLNGDFFECFWFGERGWDLYIKKRGQETLDTIERMRFRNADGSLWGMTIMYDIGDYYSLSASGEAWTSPPIPEARTYGVIFGAVGLGLAVWRKKRRVSLLT